MDIDIYGDLDNLDNQFEVVQQENEQLKDTVQKLEETSIKFSIEIKELKRINTNLEVNISSLFKTAKAEIERKNKQISELRKNLDNMLFKRDPKNKSYSVNNDSKDKEILTKQYEKAQSDLDQKNRIIQNLNMELETVRKELQERNNKLKRDSSRFSDESHMAKKLKLDRETFIENEEEYRNYKNRHEMRENGKYRKFANRERGGNDLRSRLDLKRINYRRSRSRSREGTKYNKYPRDAHYRGTYVDKPDSPDYVHNYRVEKYAIDYLNVPGDQIQNYNSVQSEYNFGAFNAQTTHSIVDRKLFDSPTFRNVKGGDIDGTHTTTVDEKNNKPSTTTAGYNSLDLFKNEQIAHENLNNTVTPKETLKYTGNKLKDLTSVDSANKIPIHLDSKYKVESTKNQTPSNIHKNLTLMESSCSNSLLLTDNFSISKTSSTSTDSVKEFIIGDSWEIIDNVKNLENPISENVKTPMITDNIKSVNSDTNTDKKAYKTKKENLHSEKGNLKTEKENYSKTLKSETNTNKNRNSKFEEKLETKNKSEKTLKDSLRSKKDKEVTKSEKSKSKKDDSKSQKNKDKNNSKNTTSKSDTKSEKSSEKNIKLKSEDSTKIVKPKETNLENNSEKIGTLANSNKKIGRKVDKDVELQKSTTEYIVENMDTNISIVEGFRPETFKKDTSIFESDTNISLVSEVQPNKSKPNEARSISPNSNIVLVPLLENKNISSTLSEFIKEKVDESRLSLKSDSSTTLSANSPLLEENENSRISHLNNLTPTSLQESQTDLKSIEVPPQTKPAVRGRRRRCIISIT